jgi:hypothetical protein
MKTSYSAPLTSVHVLTYPNVLPITTPAPRNVKFSLPPFVTLSKGAMTKDSFQHFFNPPDSTQMTRITGVTIITSSMSNHTSLFPDVRSQSFRPQQTNTLPIFENIGSDCGADFQDPRMHRQNKKTWQQTTATTVAAATTSVTMSITSVLRLPTKI